MKKKLLIILILLILIVLINFIFISKKTNKEITSNGDSTLVKNTYYDCKGKSYKKEDYTIYNNIKLHFENEKIIYGSRIQTYEFKLKEKYNEFKIEENEYFKPTSIEKNDEKLIVTYKFTTYQQQEENETEKQYIKKMEQQGYKCEIDK